MEMQFTARMNLITTLIAFKQSVCKTQLISKLGCQWQVSLPFTRHESPSEMHVVPGSCECACGCGVAHFNLEVYVCFSFCFCSVAVYIAS